MNYKIHTEEEIEDEEDCVECRVAVGIGMYLNVCKQLDSKETCNELFKKVTKEQISPKELFDLIKEKAKDSPEKLEMLKQIDELVNAELEEDDGKP